MQYELCIICQKEDDRKTVEKILAESGAKIKFSQNIGRRKLVYPIKKENSANYFSFYFDLDAKEIPSFHKILQDEQNLLRFLLVKNDIDVNKLNVQGRPAKKPQLKKKFTEMKKPVIAEKTLEEIKVAKEPKEEVKEIAKLKPKTKKIVKSVKNKEKISHAETLEKNVEKNAAADEAERIKKLEEKLDELLKE